MKKQLLMASCVLMLIASPVAAQIGSGSGSGSGFGSGSNGDQATASSSSSSSQKESASQKATTTTTTRDDFWAKFVRTLTNVQIEVTLTDQLGTQAPEKKTVSMIVASGNMGKVRSSATI